MDVLITAGQLADRLASGRRTVVLDVRWKLGSDTGHGDYLAGHVPGAVYVDLETELAAPPSAGQGRHPLPDPAVFAAAVLRWGIHPGDTVVAYDAVGGLSAARAWWLLRDAGLDTVLLLDGGWAAWQEAGGGSKPARCEPTRGPGCRCRARCRSSTPIRRRPSPSRDPARCPAGALSRRGRTGRSAPRPHSRALSASTAENLDATGRFPPPRACVRGSPASTRPWHRAPMARPWPCTAVRGECCAPDRRPEMAACGRRCIRGRIRSSPPTRRARSPPGPTRRESPGEDPPRLAPPARTRACSGHDAPLFRHRPVTGCSRTVPGPPVRRKPAEPTRRRTRRRHREHAVHQDHQRGDPWTLHLEGP